MLTRICRQAHRVAAMLSLMVSLGATPSTGGAQTLPNLSLDSLKIPVSGVALYPDDLLTLIFQASRHPLQIRAAAQGGPATGPSAPGRPLARLR